MPVEARIGNTGSLTVEPSSILIDVTNKRENDYPIRISNNTDNKISISTRFVPFSVATDTARTIDFYEDRHSIIETAVYLSSTIFDIDVGEEKTVQLRTQGKNFPLFGDYYEAIFFDVVSSESTIGTIKNKSLPADVNTSIAVPIFLKSNPNSKAKYIVEMAKEPKIVTFGIEKDIELTIKNIGNTYGIPSGEINIKDSFGNLLYIGSINTDSSLILPSTSITTNVALRKNSLSFPTYLGAFTVKMRESKKTEIMEIVYLSKFIGIDPIFMVTFIVGVLFIAFYIFRSNEKKLRN
jgi:hypothetical protein